MYKSEAEKKVNSYVNDMELEELSERTIHKYLFDINQWLSTQKEIIDMKSMREYKKNLIGNYAVASVNSKIIAVNRYLKWLGKTELNLKLEKLQSSTSLENTITKSEYFRLLGCAKQIHNYKMYYIMKTIASTGIRIGELKYVTVEAVIRGKAEVYNKGKHRSIYMAEKLSDELLQYCKINNIESGIIFYGRDKQKGITSAGVWKNMKQIAMLAEVPLEKVYPHSLRHLFAKTFMEKVGDVTELSDLLGHSRLETTWIYTRTSSEEKRNHLEKLEL